MKTMSTETQQPEPLIKQCIICGVDFECNPSRWWRLYCSVKCKAENHYRDLKEARRIRRENRDPEALMIKNLPQKEAQ